MPTVCEETICPNCKSNNVEEGVEFIEDQCYGNRCEDCDHEWDFA
jgi:transposase-like protein